MSPEQFERTVLEAIQSLPQPFLARLENVDVVVEKEPTAAQKEENGIDKEESLYGLFEGVPLTMLENYGDVLPNKITIFQGPLERDFPDVEQLTEQIHITVLHELAHHFGIDDDRAYELGL